MWHVSSGGRYTFQSGDVDFAHKFFGKLSSNYSCGQFVVPIDGGGSLVIKDPGQGHVALNGSSDCKYGQTAVACLYKDLIDWPVHNDSLLPPDHPDKSCCRDGYVMNNASAVINAHVWAAHQHLAWLAAATGQPKRPFEATSTAIKIGTLKHLARPWHACDPPVGPCFADGMLESHTSIHATMYIVGQGMLTPAEAQPYFHFLEAKSRPFPRCSAALSHFLLEALYIIAEGQSETNQAADLAFDIMARHGHRSWQEMLAQNATMTIEHWFGVNLLKHTWSHPWSSAPATIIVRRVFGVRSLAMAYKTVAIHPQPPHDLSSATISVPTARGIVSVSFLQTGKGFFELNLTIPNNTAAHVCLPTALLYRDATLVLNSVAIDSTSPQAGQLCLPELLKSGVHNIQTAQQISMDATRGRYNGDDR
eukprot:SAG31_NODE_2819_length_5041_cov_10.089235_3_plen_421_part_00